MKNTNIKSHAANQQESGRPEYVAPVIRVMTESEVLSAFQITAAGTSTWWAM